MNKEELKSSLIQLIQTEVTKPKKEQSSYLNAVWFYPKEGHFLFDDCLLDNDIAQDLIKDKRINFIGIENHQGEKMPKYSI